MYLEKFTKFLKSVDLQKYREEYRPIKIVEMDLPRNIQAISLLYDVYWNQKNFIPFGEFYEIYLKKKKKFLEDFRNKIRMCKKCFYLGLPARIYRTWASLITQIHAGYVAESIFGEETVSMSEELDHQGADIQVKYKGYILNYQVKKESMSREVRVAKKVKKSISGEFIDLFYNVPAEQYFKNSKKKSGEYRTPYLRFINNKNLERFNNGFVVFTKEAFLPKKRKIDSNLK
ncbi:TaqI family restriction endonuclease [Patescibacteria group bacterium]|nr:TaqI family restriction endonuclease [Patescibacteria group bacterium]